MPNLNDIELASDRKKWTVDGFGAFRPDGDGGRSFGAGSAVIQAAGSVLGGDHNPRDHAVIAGCSAQCFLAAFRRNGAWRVGWRDCGESLRAARACIRKLRIHPGTALRGAPLRSKRISVRRRYTGDCAVGAADWACLGSGLSSVRRSVHRNWGGLDLCGRLAGEGSHTIGEKLNPGTDHRRSNVNSLRANEIFSVEGGLPKPGLLIKNSLGGLIATGRANACCKCV